MNIWNIAVKEIKRDFRDIRTLVFMLAFPVVLMLILGTALTNAFGSTATVGDLNVLYKVTSASGPVTQAWDSFIKEAGKSGIAFDQASEQTDGKQEVEDNRYTGYVEIGDSGLHYYGSSKNSIESNIVQGMLEAFTDKYKLASVISQAKPDQVSAILAGGKDDYIRETSLNAAKQPGSLDYYAISMTTMIALYSAFSASSLIRGERRRNTASRLIASPVSKVEIFTGKILGNFVLNSVCIAIVVLFSKFVFKADWGDHPGMIALVLLTEVLLAVSLGLGLSYIFKEDASTPVIMIGLQVASFLGGAYFPVGDAKGFMIAVSNLSPLRWANTAITQIIYSNHLAAAVPAILLNVGVAALFLIIAAVSFQRREGL